MIKEKIRSLAQVPLGEFTDAVIQMCKKLRIAGSTATYNVYKAMEEEYLKDLKTLDEYGEVPKNRPKIKKHGKI